MQRRKGSPPSNVLPFRIPTRTEDPKLPPASAGVVVKFPVRLDDFADVDPVDISVRFLRANRRSETEVPLTQREADAVRYWRAQLDATPRPKTVIAARG